MTGHPERGEACQEKTRNINHLRVRSSIKDGDVLLYKVKGIFSWAIK